MTTAATWFETADQSKDALIDRLFEAKVDEALMVSDVVAAVDAWRLDRDYLRSLALHEKPRLMSNVTREIDALQTAHTQLTFRRGSMRGDATDLQPPRSLAPWMRILAGMSTAAVTLAFLAGTHGAHGTTIDVRLMITALGLSLVLILPSSIIESIRVFILRRPYATREVAATTRAVALGVALALILAGIARVYHVPRAQTSSSAWTTTFFLAGLSVSGILGLALVPDILVDAVLVRIGFLMAWTVPAIGIAVLSGGRARDVAIAQPRVSILLVSGVLVLAIPILAIVRANSNVVYQVKKSFREAYDRAGEALAFEAVMPFLRDTINSQAPSYATSVGDRLDLTGLEGLVTEVPTRWVLKLDALLSAMRGGSIGIAGPRGAGKTTLIRSFVEGRNADARSALSAIVSAPVQYNGKEFLLHLYSAACRAVIEDSALHATRGSAVGGRRRAVSEMTPFAFALLVFTVGVALVVLPSSVPITTSALVGIVLAMTGVGIAGFTSYTIRLRRPLRRPSTLDTADLLAVANEKLAEIRYQQTLSSTWSGTVKLTPVGLEGALTEASTLVRHPMTTPEIVDSLKHFLRRATLKGRVIVGIDELDKIELEGSARELLNDIKGVFGVPGCYFLVSISEDAMANFERRGLPFRDVFDSSLDEILRVGFMSPEESLTLLDRRVIGLPIPFKYFCYSLSGGLPRDLIRTARAVSVTITQERQYTLPMVAQTLMDNDVRQKSDGIASALNRLTGGTIGVAGILRSVQPIQTGRCTSAALLARIESIRESVTTRATVNASTMDAHLYRLASELCGYYYYSATLVNLFVDETDTVDWRVVADEEQSERRLEQLALARQLFTVSPHLAWDAVTAFRCAWSMTVLEEPTFGSPKAPEAGR